MAPAFRKRSSLTTRGQDIHHGSAMLSSKTPSASLRHVLPSFSDFCLIRTSEMSVVASEHDELAVLANDKVLRRHRVGVEDVRDSVHLDIVIESDNMIGSLHRNIIDGITPKVRPLQRSLIDIGQIIYHHWWAFQSASRLGGQVILGNMHVDILGLVEINLHGLTVYDLWEFTKFRFAIYVRSMS